MPAPQPRDFQRTLLALADAAPSLPPWLLTQGLEAGHSLRRLVGERPVDSSLWEELLALRRGPGADAFFAQPCAAPPQDLLLERAVEITALVEAVRSQRRSHAGQPLNRILRLGRLRTRRVAISDEWVPVAVRLGTSFVVVQVADEHPRHLRDRIEAAFLDRARPLGAWWARPVPAPILVALDPLPFAEAAHAHRIGLAGPWLSWSTTTGSPALGVLAAHHLVLEGPNFARVRTDFRRRVRALRTALGLDATEPDDELFGPFDSAPFRRREPFPMGSVADHVGVAQEFAPWEPTLPAIDEARRATYAFDPGQPEPEAEPELPDSLRAVRNRRPPAWLGPLQLPGYRGAPSLRYATVERGAFSLPAFSYAFCRAQHEALALHDPRYTGGGFTFIVPHRSGAAAQRGSRGQPVLCAFRTFDGEAEGIAAFAARMQRQLDAAEQGEDLLSRVLDDALRLAVPDALKAAAVLALERFPGDGGSFLGGRGLVSRIELDDELVDPVARYAGLHDGVFGGSCQERGGVSLTAIDRGERRDLGAVGTGVFRRKQAMDLFWQRFAWYLGG